MRKSLCLLAVIASLVSLTACSSATSQSQSLASPGECADTSDGSASKAITVSGDFGTTPKVTFAKGKLEAGATERTIIAKGDGERVDPGDTTFVEMSIYNAVTGSIVAQTAYGASPATAIVVNDQKYLKGLVRAVECTNVGSRVAAFVTAGDGFGSAGSSDGTVQPDQPLVVVADVLSTVHSDAKADGVPQEPVAGMPTVELDTAGRPTVTIPQETAPADLQVAVLKQGDGAVVQPDAEVIINYQGVNWRTGQVFDESWGNGPTNFQLSAVVKGFSSAIAGQKIGSQVIAVIPPDLGYGPSGGNSQAGIEADDTIVFVIDILDASSTTVPAAG